MASPKSPLASYLWTMSKLELLKIGCGQFLCKSPPWLFQCQSYLPLKFEKVSDHGEFRQLTQAGVISSVPLSFFSSGGEGTVSVGFLSLP